MQPTGGGTRPRKKMEKRKSHVIVSAPGKRAWKGCRVCLVVINDRNRDQPCKGPVQLRPQLRDAPACADDECLRGEGMTWPGTVEAWASYDEQGDIVSHMVSSPSEAATSLRARELAEEPEVVRIERVWSMEAASWNEAMAAWHERQGFEPYKPMAEAE